MGTGGHFPGAKRGRVVTLTTHPHLVPRSRGSRSYTSSPPRASMACSGTDYFSDLNSWFVFGGSAINSHVKVQTELNWVTVVCSGGNCDHVDDFSGSVDSGNFTVRQITSQAEPGDTWLQQTQSVNLSHCSNLERICKGSGLEVDGSLCALRPPPPPTNTVLSPQFNS
jgi:hypothetical protein